MTSPRIFFFAEGRADAGDELRAVLGAKGAGLAEMARAGLPVPTGFIIPTECCRVFFASGQRLPDAVADGIRAALARLELEMGRRLGDADRPLLVAVRSGAAVSMPGMMDTLLNVGGTPEAVLNAVTKVLASWQSERASAYRRNQGITEQAGTAVIIQVMVPAEVSGVLFTANPQNGDRAQMLIEATRGLGDTLVSGKVTPHRVTVAREDGQIIKREMGDTLTPGLDETQLAELLRLARQVERLFGNPCDIEWAWSAGRIFLLQARPIRGLNDAPLLHALRRENIERLHQLAGGRRCAWVAHNLGETLPTPTPMSWAILRQFMSGNGGYGKMYRDLGYHPSERVRQEGFLDLICGRIYLNTQRHAELFWGDFPFAYDLELIRREPALAETLPTRIDPSRFSLAELIKVPGVWRCMRRVRNRTQEVMADFDTHFEKDILPLYLAEVERKRHQDLRIFDNTQLLCEFTERTRLIDDFGRAAVTLSFCAGQAFEVCRLELRKRFPGSSEAILGNVTAGLSNKTVEADRRLRDVAEGNKTPAQFLEEFGHWADGALELAQPRWREQPEWIERMIARLREDPAREGRHQDLDDTAWVKALAPPGTGRPARRLTEACIRLRRYLPYRQTGKHFWLMAYDLLRLVLLEIERRTGLDGGVFFLEPNELAPLLQGMDFSAIIAERRRRRFETRIPVPTVLMSDDLEEIGRPTESAASGPVLQGTGLAPGSGSGPAAIVSVSADAEHLPPGYVLVCASADPAWTALFLHASGLIVEHGGLLSHCAIVARDFGIPAVVLPAATRILKSGEKLAVDGSRGTVVRS